MERENIDESYTVPFRSGQIQSPRDRRMAQIKKTAAPWQRADGPGCINKDTYGYEDADHPESEFRTFCMKEFERPEAIAPAEGFKKAIVFRMPDWKGVYKPSELAVSPRGTTTMAEDEGDVDPLYAGIGFVPKSGVAQSIRGDPEHDFEPLLGGRLHGLPLSISDLDGPRCTSHSWWDTVLNPSEPAPSLDRQVSSGMDLRKTKVSQRK